MYFGKDDFYEDEYDEEYYDENGETFKILKLK